MTSLQQQLDQMIKRSVTLHGFTYDTEGNLLDADKANKEFLRTLASLEPDPKEQAKMLVEAWEDKSGTLMRALNAVRVEQVGNYIVSESNFMSAFFEQVTLKDDEEPYVVNDTAQEIRVGHVGEDGTPDHVRVVKPEAKTAIALRFLMSEIVRYKTLDVYKGRVAEVAKKTFDISRDLTFKLDRECFNLLSAPVANGGCFGAFSTEQGNTNKAKRIYLAHSGIVTAHLPTTNDYDMTQAAGSATNPAPDGALAAFGIKVLKAIIDYSDRWGNVLPGGGRLVPTGEIIVPSSDIIAIANDATPQSNAQENRIQEEINRLGYTMLTYLGRAWKFIADVTIVKGSCYPRFNILPGRVYFKPTFDKEFVETNESENWEKRWQRKVYGAYVISQYRPRALRLKYAN